MSPARPVEPPFSVRIPFLLLEDGVTKVTLVRHAQQAYPTSIETFTHGDWADPPLSQLGKAQAMAVGSLLAEHEVDVVACSTMGRAMETAQIIAAPHGLVPDVRPELVEIQSYRDIPDDVEPQSLVDPDEWAAREAAFHRKVTWDLMFFGERSGEFRERIVTAIERLLADHAGKHIVLVSHGGVINGYLAWILGIDEDMFFLPNHCSITTVWAKGDVRRVHSVNERQHLHEGLLTN